MQMRAKHGTKATPASGPAKGKKGKQSMAAGADKYALYRLSVQDPEHEVPQFVRFFKDSFGRPPLSLREDFCAAAAVCAEWVRGNPERTAIGVDLDPEPLAYGEKHYLSLLTPAQRERVELLEQDVLTCTRKAEVIAAQNYSFFIFKTRELVLKYFQAVHRSLEGEGIFVLDMMGGSEVMLDEQEEGRQVARPTAEDKRNIPPFRYVWEEASFDPITAHVLFHIHFRFPDGSAIEKAFTYDWRLWTLPEIRELLQEAGFSAVHVYWETLDKEGEPSGNYRRATKGRADRSWLSYVVAEK
jgi:hypothetical protein